MDRRDEIVMNSLFFDILGALTGFVVVLLLLSIIVTALVQITQALLRLRGRNLVIGLTSVLAAEQDLFPSYNAAKTKAREILYHKEAPTLRGGIVNPHSVVAPETVGKWLGPQISWLRTEDLKDILKDSAITEDEQMQKRIVTRFNKIQDLLCKRFLRTMRVWTVLWALPVAFYFQVSTPALLSDFLTVPGLQETAFNMVPAGQNSPQGKFKNISGKALHTLAQVYPQHQAVLQKLMSKGQDESDIVQALSSALKNEPERQKLVAEYEQLFGTYYRAELDAALKTTAAASQQLSLLNIEPWREEWDFYVHDHNMRWNNWVGVLMTTILLSFGAPFWFNVLREIMNLRDSLTPPGDSTTKGSQGAG